jgi:hypothetical protein
MDLAKERTLSRLPAIGEKIMKTIIGLISASSRRLLVAASIVATFATACAAAVPALATNEEYKCSVGEVCSVANGPENWVRNNFGINHSGEGNCDKIWRKNSNGTYTLMGEQCVSGGNTAKVCVGSGEFFGHGEVESSGFPGILKGRQDNFTKCE